MTEATLDLILPPRPQDISRLPALSRLLRRAECETGWPSGMAQRLLALCGCPAQGDAALCSLADGGTPGADYWLHAAPVHLVADRDRLVLAADAAALAVTPEEAAQLAAEFNTLYEPDGWQLLPLTPERWYLRCNRPPEITTTPLQQARGRDVRSLLPRGSDAMAWHALLNEVQMLFHSSTVNARRAERGLPTINSLWPWGGGRLPQSCAVPWQQVYAASCTARGLAALAGRPAMPLPATALGVTQRAGEAGRTLAVLGPDAGDWARWERAWFEPLREAVRDGRLAVVMLHPVDSTAAYRLDRRGVRRWWRGVWSRRGG